MSTGEESIRDAHARGEFDLAVRTALAHYQTEVFSFLCDRLRSEADAHEVFSQLNEDIWRGIAGFRWQCSFRTWLYTLARHAAIRFERSPANRAGHRQPLSRAPEAPVQERSRTRPYQRTDVKDRFAALRATLSADEQSLLVLRVDRELAWEEVARILSDGEVDEAELKRASTNLRQRFRQLTLRLREMARAEGLLDEEPDA